MVGQTHGGFLSIFMKALSRASMHIWFERSDAKDRSKVIEKLRNHAHDSNLPPILIYPEGVCVNNTSVMQFKKGAFEVDTVIYPIAIRFDARFGDAFWWQDKFLHYVLCHDDLVGHRVQCVVPPPHEETLGGVSHRFC